MSLLRFLGRSLFAAAFIADGVKKFTSPAEQADDAAGFTNTVAPVVQRITPAAYSSYVPDKPETWVRITGAAEVLGGAMFATGIGRRLGALLLVKASALNLAIAWPDKEADDEDKAAGRSKVLTQAALLGAAIVAAQDLQGKPSLAWRTEHGVRAAADKADKLKGQAKRKAEKAAKKAKKQAKRVGKKIDSAVS